jgi:hypothetical protein
MVAQAVGPPVGPLSGTLELLRVSQVELLQEV